MVWVVLVGQGAVPVLDYLHWGVWGESQVAVVGGQVVRVEGRFCLLEVLEKLGKAGLEIAEVGLEAVEKIPPDLILELLGVLTDVIEAVPLGLGETPEFIDALVGAQVVAQFGQFSGVLGEADPVPGGQALEAVGGHRVDPASALSPAAPKVAVVGLVQLVALFEGPEPSGKKGFGLLADADIDALARPGRLVFLVFTVSGHGSSNRPKTTPPRNGVPRNGRWPPDRRPQLGPVFWLCPRASFFHSARLFLD